uniref:Uncharacterized protein n=1 Tax=Glossina pallidipes TaxID=7398 RepID=A0A1A9ZPC0_GLOPL
MADCELAFKVNEPIVCLSNCTDKVENKAGKTPCSLKFNEVPPVTDKTGDKSYIILPFAAISKPLPAPKSSSSHPLLSSLRPQTTNPPEPLPFVDTRLPLIITVSRLTELPLPEQFKATISGKTLKTVYSLLIVR